MLEITVKTLDSQNHTFTVDDDITVRGFKDHIAETVAVAAESQRLIYYGRVLQDDKKLNDYDVNGKVIHLVQRAPPQPEARSSNNDGQRQNNSVPVGRVYRSHVHRNAMYLSAMLPTEVVEGPGLPTPQLSNTLSNSRLVSARRMLNKAIQLMDRLDDPSMPLHPSPTESNAPESVPQASAPEEADQDSNVNSNINNTRNRMVQAASEIAAAFSAAALINIRLSRDNGENGANVAGSVNVIDPSQMEQTAQASAQPMESEVSDPIDNGENGGNVAGSVNVIDPSQMEQTAQASAQPMESEVSEPGRSEPQTSEPKTSETDKSEKEKAEPGRSGSAKPETQRSEAERSGSERADASTSNNNDNQNTSRRSTPQVPRPPQMAELLERLVNTQDRLRPYIERYRVLMLADPSLTPGSGPEGVAENQRIVDGVSECLHYVSHACHALSDIIVDMGQQPPRNLRCRPIIIQHSAILQAGIPIQVESHVNLSAPNVTNNNNTTDEGNEATRPSSPTSAASDQTSRSSNANNRSMPQNTNGHQNQSSLLGTLLNLPNNVELTMELSPQSAMDLSSPNAADSTDNEQGQSNNNNNNINGNVGGSGGLYSMAPPFALIRDALQSVLSERHSQMETSSGSSMNTQSNLPFVTIVGQQIDFGTPNSGQSTQARSNIGTHPTTSTQTRSTARPHVLHPHTHPLGMGMGMTQSIDFDPILPCHSHHIRRAPPATANSTSTSQSNQANQSTTSESHSRSQSASRSSTSARTVPVNVPVNIRDLLENDGQALGNGIDINIVGGDLHISLIGNMPNTSEVPLAEILRSLNVRLEDFTGRNFLIDLWLFMLRNITFGGLMQLSLGQPGPLINLRRPLREFLEISFTPPMTTLQERVAEKIVTLSRPYLEALIVHEVEADSRQIDMPATIEALLRKFCLEFLKLLFNNDLDNATFAQEAVTLARMLEEQSSAVLQHILQGQNTSLETIASRFVNQFTEGIHPLFQQTLLGILSTRIRAFATRTTQMTQSEITSLLVYKNQPSAPPAESAVPVPSKPQVKPEIQPEEQAQAQALPLQQQQQQSEQQQSLNKEMKTEEKLELKPEAMETDSLSDKKLDDSMDLNGEEIPETFPGAEHLPPEWVPIIARDSVIQRRQTQLQAQQGGPIPFSDAYLSGLPSKRRKLIEQQKPQLLVSPTANSTAITASVERLVREGIGHTQLEEAEGAAHAVAATPAVRSAFGQAIKDCLHPGRLRTPDFPNSTRFPNASKFFADQNKEQEAKTSATTANKSSK